MTHRLKALSIILMISAFFVSAPARAGRARNAGVQITGDVPASAADAIARAGFDTVIIFYSPYRTPNDARIMKHLGEWGAKAAALRFKLYVRLDTGGSLDAVADMSKVKFRPAAFDNGYALGHKPAPASSAFWDTAIFPKIGRLVEISRKTPLNGIFLNLDGHVSVSYDSATFAEFLGTKEPETDAAAIQPVKRKTYLSGKGILKDYEKFQEEQIAAFTERYFRGIKSSAPEFEIHFASGKDDPLHGAFRRVVKELRIGGGAALFPFHTPADLEGNASGGARRIPALSVREFPPDEMAAMIGALGLWKSGFIVSDADVLWKDLRDASAGQWPLGVTEDYLGLVAKAKSAGDKDIEDYQSVVKRLSNRLSGTHDGPPKAALIYSRYMESMYRDVFDALLSAPGVALDKYENTALEKLIPRIGQYDVIITAPGYNAVESEKFYPFAGALLDWVKRGGALFVLDATAPEQTDWLGKADPELRLVVETNDGLAPEWIDREFRMMGFPSRIASFPMGKTHFGEAASGWRHIARDNQDKPYAVQRLYGNGMLLVISHMTADPEFLMNAWAHMQKIKDRFDAAIDPHAKPLVVGRNDMAFTVSTIGAERKLRVSASILSDDRRLQTAEAGITLAAGNGARLKVPVVMDGGRLYRVTLTFADEETGMVDRRDSFSFLAPAEFEITADKSYYTGEKEILARVTRRTSDGFGNLRADVSLVSKEKGVLSKGRMIGSDAASRTAALEVPDGTGPGEYFVEATVRDGGRIIWGPSALPVKKLRPGLAAETKMLHFRDGLLEVGGEPYFPLGIYSIPPENLDELRGAGVNGMIYYGNSIEEQSGMNSAVQGKGIKFAAYPLRAQDLFMTGDHAKLKEEISAKARNAGMFMWYLADEPELFGQSPELIGGLYKFVREIDPYRPQAIVMMSPENFDRYADGTDIFMFDRYPTPQAPLESVGLYARRAIQAVHGRKPVFAIPQAFSWDAWNGTYREGKEHRPNYAEMRSSAVQSIAAGVKGVIYWAFTGSRYDMRKFPDHLNDFKRLMRELSGLMDVLEEPNAPIEMNLQPDLLSIGWGAKIHDGKLYLFVYNGDPARRESVRFTLPGDYSGQTVGVYGENRSIPMRGASFADSFDDYGTHIYIVPEKGEAGPR